MGFNSGFKVLIFYSLRNSNHKSLVFLVSFLSFKTSCVFHYIFQNSNILVTSRFQWLISAERWIVYNVYKTCVFKVSVWGAAVRQPENLKWHTVKSYQLSRILCCLHFQILVVQEAHYLLKIWTVRSFKTCVTIYQSTWRNTVEDLRHNC